MLLRFARYHLSLLSGCCMHCLTWPVHSWESLLTRFSLHSLSLSLSLSLSQAFTHTAHGGHTRIQLHIHTHIHTVEVGSAFIRCVIQSLPHLLPDCGETTQCFQSAQPQGPCCSIWLPGGTTTGSDTLRKVC